MDSEHPLFILYTSGSTGKPKGVLHTTGGYAVYVSLTTRWVFDLKDSDTYWCTADVGWVTGHSYVVYGPLMNHATAFMYEGAPTTPGPDRFWEMIARNKITILYTAPTAIRAFMRLGDEHPKKHDMSSLRLLGTVGEPINPEAWIWYREVIGRGRCPIVDTWWQTETGGIMVTPLPGATPTKPGSATLPLPGIKAEVLDKDGKPVPLGSGGKLFITRPWPAMLRTLYKDPERYASTYFSEIPGKYFTGDGARIDQDGYLWVMGRVDDVVNVAGHRLGTAEVESALVSEGRVAEAAVVGRPDELKGTSLVAFVTSEEGRWSPRRPSSRRCRPTWRRRSGRSPVRTRSASRRACPRPGPARSCAGSSGTWPRAARPRATRRRSRTSTSSLRCETTRTRAPGAPCRPGFRTVDEDLRRRKPTELPEPRRLRAARRRRSPGAPGSRLGSDRRRGRARATWP